MPDSKHVYHLFVIRVPERDILQNYLKDSGIHTGIHYPIPCHLQKAYDFLGPTESAFPVSEQYAKEILSLPMYAELTDKAIGHVCSKIEEFYG
jgi:dTDP-4-amino-4,6-dideoxygalactose transaminase